MEYVSKLADDLRDELEILNIIGEGVSSRAYLVLWKGEKKVLKVSKKSIGDYRREGNSSPLEYDVLTRFKHPYLMEIEHIYANLKYNGVAILLPYYTKTYNDCIEGGLFTVIEKLNICYKIAEVSKFLFENGILHLDIKPDNILIDKGGNPILSDFDIAIKIDSTESMVSLERDVIALQIRPYELLVRNTNLIGEHTLVFQLGYLIYMSFISKLFSPQNRNHMKKHVEDNYNEINIKTTIKKLLSESITDLQILDLIVDLLSNMITPIARKRYNLKEVFSHPLWDHIKKEESKGYVIEPETPKYIECSNSVNRLFNHMLSYSTKYFTGYNLHGDILFSAIDLLYRTVYLVSGKSNKCIISLEIACCFLAWKLYVGYVNPERLKVDDFIISNPYSLLCNISNIDVLTSENEIITKLEGKLCRTFIYNSVLDGNFIQIINDLILDYEKYILFKPERINCSNRKNLWELLFLKKIKI